MKVVNCTLLLTRACNLSCSYCKVFDNNFPNELNGKQWGKALDILEKLGCQFNILLGGEPTRHPDIMSIIEHCHERHLPYALCTNGVFNNDFKEKLKKIHLKNYSISYDGDCNQAANPGSIGKSMTGLKTALEFKKEGVPDVHATITITKKNLKDIPDIVQGLSDSGIWVEISALHWSKGDLYNVFPEKDSMKDLTLDDIDIEASYGIMTELKKMKKEGVLLHNDPEYFDAFPRYAKDLNWKCEGGTALCIESDGTMRTCLHYNGIHCGKFTIFDLENPESFELFEKAMTLDIQDCGGCFWDCKFQAQQWQDNDKKAKEVFQHGRKF